MSGMPPVAVFPPLPDSVPRVATDDLDEMRWLVRDRDGNPGWVVQHGRGRLGYWQQRLFGLDTHVACGHTGQAVTVRGQVGGLVLQLAIPAGSSYRLGRRQVTTTPGSVALLPPGQEFTRRSPAGTMLALRFEAPRVAAELAARLGRPLDDEPWAFAVPSLSVAERQAFSTAVADLITLGGPQGSMQARRHVDARLHALLVGLLQRQHRPARAGWVSAARLAALEAWIDAHLAEPLTLGQLCAQAGVGARSLQLAFEARRGMSPMRHVAERRFAAAHQRLMRAMPQDAVTTIALDCGFDHMSRFALGYRQVFGQSPSQTLAARRRTPPRARALSAAATSFSG